MNRVVAAALLSVALAACASVPPPAVLSQVDAARQGAAAQEAKLYAHGAYARAEKLRDQAHKAWDAGDHTAAQILGERAIAAYAHALGLARITRADAAGRAAAAQLAKAQSELGTI